MNADKALRRTRSMRLQPHEVHDVVEFLAQWNPYALDAALNHVAQLRLVRAIEREKRKTRPAGS